MQLLEKNLRKLNETMPRVVDDALRHLLPHAALQKIERERETERKNIYVTEIRCIGRCNG